MNKRQLRHRKHVRLNGHMIELIGKYESDLLKLCKRRDLRRLDDALHLFFQEFPDYSQPDQFTFCETDWFKRLMEQDGMDQRKIESIITYAHGFFEWAIEMRDYEMPNPCSKRLFSKWAALRGSSPQPDIAHLPSEPNENHTLGTSQFEDPEPALQDILAPQTTNHTLNNASELMPQYST